MHFIEKVQAVFNTHTQPDHDLARNILRKHLPPNIVVAIPETHAHCQECHSMFESMRVREAGAVWQRNKSKYGPYYALRDALSSAKGFRKFDNARDDNFESIQRSMGVINRVASLTLPAAYGIHINSFSAQIHLMAQWFMCDTPEQEAYSLELYTLHKMYHAISIIPDDRSKVTGGYIILWPRPKVFVDAQIRLHQQTGPAVSLHGLDAYFWKGVSIPRRWIQNKESITYEDCFEGNVERRAIACEILGWAKVLDMIGASTIDISSDPSIGTLLQAHPPGMLPTKFLVVKCGTGRTFALIVPDHCQTAHEANAWTYGLPANMYKPEVRT